MGSNINSSALTSKEKELEMAKEIMNSDEENVDFGEDNADNPSDNLGKSSADNNSSENDNKKEDTGGEAEEDSDATDEPQQTAEEEEDEAEYIKGGYHPVSIDDAYSAGRYHVLRKLGWGHFSTVWLAKDQKQPHHQQEQSSPVVALKIVKSAQHYSETAIDEIKLLEKVVNANPNNQNRRKIVELKDWFKIKGPNGSHVTMAFEVLGPNLLTLIRQYHHRGIPVLIVKRIMKQNVLICVDVDETLGLAHKEIGPLTAVPPAISTAVLLKSKKVRQKASLAIKANKKSPTKNDLLNGIDITLTATSSSSSAATLSSPSPNFPAHLRHPSTTPNTFHPKRKETMQSLKSSNSSVVSLLSLENSNNEKKFEMKGLENPERSAADAFKNRGDGIAGVTGDDASEIDRKKRRRDERREKKRKEYENIQVKIADLGNACWTHHHFTSDIQTRQYRSPEAILGADYDTSADMWSVGCMTFELITGDYLFDPQAGTRYTKDDDHIAQISELLGGFPKSVALSGKYSSEIFNRRGELRHIHKLRFWGISDVLQEKYHFSKLEADEIAAFILPMIEIHPERRATAAEMLGNPWICDVDVDDVRRRWVVAGIRDAPVAKSSSDYASGGDTDEEDEEEEESDESVKERSIN
ncbi:serine/threonine protein kinase, CMGC group [Physocladia obscura]|uniref:non-specific serine/threonine protein kinase n=1 Tax=Physocladia obscura TaxID=109957 RepID=A0AAD5T1U4_9FUNG|nr:serine/threonine protein kinase, CMGC group [Physocladia obscura]